MTLNDLKIFSTVYAESSVTKAANKLYISQPSVSKAIKTLEMELGLQLFERYANRLYVTDAGHMLYEYASLILGSYSRMIEAAHNYKKKKLIRIGCGIVIGSAFLPDIIHNYCKEHPDCEVKAVINSTELLEPLLLNNELDFCIAECKDRPKNLHFESLSASPLVAFCHNSHPLAGQSHVTLKDLADYDLLLPDKLSQVQSQIEACFANINVNVVPKWESVNTHALILAAENNLGVAILPLDFLNAFSHHNICILDVPELNIKRHINLFYSLGKQLEPEALDFINYFRDFLTKKTLRI